ncbi:MAG: hypothetical protein EAZ97_00470 [Bacteroidetes bacterium]|nr:MAG: hypothetical protein EAZ97_00470 [Bacteroidota bacterium]
MSYENIREEELKNKIAQEYFPEFDSTQIIGNIDFCVTLKKESQISETESVLWAEAKKGKADIFNSITQLILTVGKARTFDQTLPPAYLGAFDAEKIAFIPYNDIQEIFYLNDFNWNVAPSNYETKEFKQVHEKIKGIIESNSLQFFYENDEQELREFIKNNFVSGKFGISKIRIDKNNFISIYSKWLKLVKPSITINWAIVKKINIIDGDFYLADLLSSENESLKDSLYVLLKKDHYQFEKKLNELEIFDSKFGFFKDKQKAHNLFWNKYERPPKTEYWDYIVERRDLLVPQDVRERKGSFFTPQIWVELSQKYLADLLGENWQDEYYIWDCAAGTGNLLTGLTNKNRIWASTLDRQDVDVMRDRILNGANLLENHVFQFDFLNDPFEKLPKDLQEIINDPNERKKLVVYINPPYAEDTNKKNLIKSSFKGKVAQNKIHDKYAHLLKKANHELFAQFFIRVYQEISGVILAQFSKLKSLQSPNFSEFRKNFQAKLKKMFVVPADTFDNVTGKFPIGFMIWDTNKKEHFTQISANIYDRKGNKMANKKIYSYNQKQYINDWLKQFRIDLGDKIGFLNYRGNDFQHQSMVFIESLGETSMTKLNINKNNLTVSCIYFAVRHCIKATWLNDRDQFLYPNKKWEKDKEFQNNCLVYTLFNNNIQSVHATNHWIPFTEEQVGAKIKFESNFMSRFLAGEVKNDLDLFKKKKNIPQIPLVFSAEAQAVLDSGRTLWTYYHLERGAEVNASLYEIKEYFQGRSEKGKMKNSSADEEYGVLIADLREKMQVLANKIEPKIYEYGFLKG